MNVQGILSFKYNNINNSKNTGRKSNNTIFYMQNPMYDSVTFEGARVDKGLQRFYEVNRDIMPKTVRKYIESLNNLASITPLEAHADAFELLKIASDVEDVRNAYPEEELFLNLRNPEEISKATRGILGTYCVYRDLFESAGKSILADKQNLTVWLLKKIFLEGKTTNEMNEDFKKEADSDFMEFYKAKEKNSDEPIQDGVFDSLGIQFPESQNSLWYTKDGVSDAVGWAISEAKRVALENMTPEELISRNKKTIEPLENWWRSIPYDRKLQMIADQEDEITLLQMYKDSEFTQQKPTRKLNHPQTQNHVSNGFKTHIHIDTIFGEDEIFKIWAGNKLKIFEAGLTANGKELLDNKRLQRRAEVWLGMAPEEKTEYLEKLKTGSEYSRYALILAWNENPEIITELSYFLRKNYIERPIDALYDTQPFNKKMSETMSRFWASNPEFGTKLGESLHNAHILIKEAVADGKFEALKKDIIRARDQRKKETAIAIRNYREILNDDEYNKYPDYMKEFIDGMRFAPDVDYKTLPSQYLKAFFKVTYENLSKDEVATWLKVWRKEYLTDSDRNNIQKIIDLRTFESEKMNRTLEATLANALYKCTKHPGVYMLSSNHCKLGMKQIADGKEKISIPLSNGELYEIPILNKLVDVKKIDEDYDFYNKSLVDAELGSIVDRYVIFDTTINADMFKNVLEELKAYMNTYGTSLTILFKDENEYSTEIRSAFLKKFMEKMPPLLHIVGIDFVFNQKDGFEREEKIAQIDKILRYRLSSISDPIMDIFIYEVNKCLRKNTTMYELNNLISSNEIGNDRNIGIDMRNVNIVNRYGILAAEQALADTMYDVTGNDIFYKFEFGALLLAVQNAAGTKKFPSITNYRGDGEAMEFTIKQKPNLFQLKNLYQKYFDEICTYVAEAKSEGEKIDIDEIMYILNPDEDKEIVDKYTKERLKRVEEYLV